MIARIADLEVIVTGTEVEALHLEQNLVKRHRPPYVRLRDDKSFPYIAVTVDDDYPRVMFTRERHRRGVVYFGPYANAKKVRETLDVLNRVFRFRPCEGPKPGRHSGIPCLDFHIDRCFAPCVDYISKEDYGKVIDGVIEFLSGETRPIIRELERRMAEAAADERFEEAARFRNRLFLRQASRGTAGGRQAGSGHRGRRDRDRRRERRGAGLPAPRREDGRPLRVPPRERRGAGRSGAAGGVRARVLRFGAVVPPQIIVPREAGDTSALAEFLSERRGSRVEVRRRAGREAPAAGAREPERGACARGRHREGGAVEAAPGRGAGGAREVLNLESLPLRIECFDVSNIQEESPVASMVVFQDATPKGALPKFGIRGMGAGRLRSARRGRLAAVRPCRDGDAGGVRRRLRAAPNLVVIDGGKGQLSAAIQAMQAYDLPRVAVISSAKRVEEVFVPDRPEPIRSSGTHSGLQLLQRIRDEAHRFALGFHRQRRDAKARESIFDTLPGVGPARRRALLKHSARAEQFLAATQEELEGVPGIPARTARQIYAQLHKAGRA